MDSLLADLRYAVRTLRRSPLFTTVAVLTLALGIGANTAIFSVVNGVLLTPLPVADPAQLVILQGRSTQGFEVSVSIPNFRDWAERTRAFSRMGAFRTSSLNLTGQDTPERLQSVQVLGDLFPTLGVSPVLGRTFSAAQAERGAERVAVLAHGFWQRRFAGAADVLGRTLTLDGQPYTVIGVMPRDFAFPSNTADLFVPMGIYADQLPWEQRGNHPGMYAVARLEPGTTLAQAQTDMNAIMRDIEASTGYKNAAEVVSLRQRALGTIEPALLVLSGAVGFVLLIACANVANLLLARGEGRQRELAVRTALGAARGRLVRQMLTESVLLGLAGGVAGLLLAAAGVRVLVAALPASTPLLDQIGLDGRVLAFTLGLALLTGLLFGLVPALRASGGSLQASLKEGTRGAGAGLERQRLRGLLVVAEMGLALVLLVGAGLMLQSFVRLQRVDPGFDAGHVLTARVSLPRERYAEDARWQAFYRELTERLQAIPGVEVAGVNNGIPLASGGTESGVIPEGRPILEENMESVLWQSPGPGYFATMRIPLLRGRYLDERDNAAAQKVAVIDERMAHAFWPDENPIGKRVAFEYEGDPDSGAPPTPVWREVVGVVANVRHYEMASPSRMQIYRPYDQRVSDGPPPGLALFVRTAGDPAAATAAVRRAVRALDAQLPLFQLQTMDEVVAQELATSRLLGGMLTVFAAIALLLAAVGIYGVMSYTVTLRTHELGVRMALGAQPGDVVRLVVRRGALLAGIGVVVGLVAAVGAGRAIAGSLYGVSATDPATFVIIPLLLGSVALLASWIPARRATRIDPVTALRGE